MGRESLQNAQGSRDRHRKYRVGKRKRRAENATAVYNAMVEYVRNALTESRESQKKLADRAGVSQGTVTSFLSGGRSVGTNLTLALLEASGIDTFDMFYTYIDKKEEETA